MPETDISPLVTRDSAWDAWAKWLLISGRAIWIETGKGGYAMILEN